MNTEEKARAYDKAIEIAKYWHKEGYGRGCQKLVEDIFPELRESDDKMIRDAIIDHLKDNNLTEWAAWLENQGQELRKVSIWKHWSGCGIAGNGDDEPIYLIKNYNTYSLSSVLSSECDYILLSDLDKLISDGDVDVRYKYLEDILKADDIYQISMNDTMVEEAKSKAIEALSKLGIGKLLGFEKQNKQKSAYMIKPKFHEGDFIKHNKANIICKVISINSGSYYVENIDTSGRIELFNTEQNFHLWTIEDAKDGDVLATKDTVFIFKHIDKAGLSLCKSYCEVIGNSELGLGFDFSINNVHPATKEQRELLFQKMKENGYEWDDEKKELKEIEHELSLFDNYNPYKAAVQHILETCYEYEDVIDSDTYAADFYDEIIVKCNNAIEYDNKYPSKKKSLNVDDLSNIQSITKILNNAKKYYCDDNEIVRGIEWVNSLKNI